MTRDSRKPKRQIGIDHYALFPLNLAPIDTLQWAVAHGADGVSFSGLSRPESEAAMDPAALEDLRAFAETHGLYLEWGGAQHIPRDMTSWARKDLADANLRAAREANALGVHVVRSCSGGLMRWDADAPPTETLLRETAETLRDQRTMLLDHAVVLAVETHFEFTSHELVRHFECCDAAPAEWLGVCLDTMNLLTMLEDPVAATRRLLPWVVTTHIKDAGVLLDADGLTTFTAAIGDGVVDLARIAGMLGSLERDVHLSIEDHGGSFFLPIYDPLFLSRFPDLTPTELARLVQLAQPCRSRLDCRPLDRSHWPRVCEERMGHDIVALRALVRTIEGHDEA